MADETRAIDRIRQRFNSARREYVVAEWGLTLYFAPLVQDDLEAAGRLKDSVKGSTDMDLNLYLFIHKATDAAGVPLFSTGDAVYLKRAAEWKVFQRAVDFMYGSMLDVATQAEKIEAALEASAPNP
jgi:hypothetical protein